MSQEIQIGANLRVVNGAFQDIRTIQLSIDQSAIGVADAVQTISHTSPTALNLVGIAANGWAVLQNVDATNYIKFGPFVSATFYPFGKLAPGESAILRIAPGVVPYAEADTADCQMRTTIYNA